MALRIEGGTKISSHDAVIVFKTRKINKQGLIKIKANHTTLKKAS